MFHATSVVETSGSVWYFDDEEGLYVRVPLNEGPRPPGPNGEDWGGPGAGWMQDGVPHNLVSWKIAGDDDCPWLHRRCDECPHLILMHPESTRGIWAPRAKVILDSRLEVT